MSAFQTLAAAGFLTFGTVSSYTALDFQFKNTERPLAVEMEILHGSYCPYFPVSDCMFQVTDLITVRKNGELVKNISLRGLDIDTVDALMKVTSGVYR